MIRGILASRFGMAWEQQRSDVIANNVANVNTDGFKRSIAVGREFSELLLKRVGGAAGNTASPIIGPLGVGVQLDQVAVDQSQGDVTVTDNPLDVALDGPGELVYQGPGGPGYTRSGSLRRDPAGRLVTSEGYPVLVGGAPVGDGAREVSIAGDGQVLVDGRAAGRLDVRGTAKIVGRSTEHSNVDLAQELTDLITALRSFQVNQRALQMQDETLAKAVSDIGRL
jgi:flagellar basal-body rod protein FlgF